MGEKMKCPKCGKEVSTRGGRNSLAVRPTVAGGLGQEPPLSVDASGANRWVEGILESLYFPEKVGKSPYSRRVICII